MYGATLTPLGGNALCDAAAGYREASPQEVNQWIRSNGGSMPWSTATERARDPRRPSRLLAATDDGDHPHLNPSGCRLFAEAVPARLFRLTPLPEDFGPAPR